jgi:hypothetical protein
MSPGAEFDVRPLTKGRHQPNKTSEQGRVFALAVHGKAPSEQGWMDIMDRIDESTRDGVPADRFRGGVRLQEPGRGRRVASAGGRRAVFDGPFLESKETQGVPARVRELLMSPAKCRARPPTLRAASLPSSASFALTRQTETEVRRATERVAVVGEPQSAVRKMTMAARRAIELLLARQAGGGMEPSTRSVLGCGFLSILALLAPPLLAQQPAQPSGAAPAVTHKVLAQGIAASEPLSLSLRTLPARMLVRHFAVGLGKTKDVAIPSFSVMEIEVGAVFTTIGGERKERVPGDVWTIDPGTTIGFENPHAGTAVIIRVISFEPNPQGGPQ